MMVQTEMRAQGVMSGDELCLYYQSRLPGFAYGLDVGCEIKRRQVCPELELPLTEVGRTRRRFGVQLLMLNLRRPLDL